MKTALILLIIFSCVDNTTWSQSYRVSGYITDAGSGEPLIGAYILLDEGNQEISRVAMVFLPHSQKSALILNLRLIEKIF